jgi:hypothetical protein
MVDFSHTEVGTQRTRHQLHDTTRVSTRARSPLSMSKMLKGMKIKMSEETENSEHRSAGRAAARAGGGVCDRSARRVITRENINIDIKGLGKYNRVQ